MPENLNILLVSPAFAPSSFGGVKAHVTNLSRALARRGHDVTVYTSNAYNRKQNMNVKGTHYLDGVRVVYFNNCFPKRYWYTPAMGPFLKQEINRFDIIHLHIHNTYPSFVAHHYAMKYKVPYILSSHGTVLRIMRSYVKKYFFDIVAGYRILKDAQKLIALTSLEAQQYKKRGIEDNRIEIIPNGIDLSEFEKLPEKGTFRKKYGLTNSQKIILFLGRIHKIKGLDLLVQAFAELSRDVDDAKLVIVGPDFGYASTLKRLIHRFNIEDKTLMTGGLFGEDKLAAYVDADLYVLSSVYETFPTTVLEACSCGIPVIVTDRCGAANLFQEAGLIIPYSKFHLCDAMRKLLSDEQLRIKLGANGKRIVTEQFNWDRIAEQLEGIYKDVCNSKEHARDA